MRADTSSSGPQNSAFMSTTTQARVQERRPGRAIKSIGRSALDPHIYITDLPAVSIPNNENLACQPLASTTTRQSRVTPTYSPLVKYHELFPTRLRTLFSDESPSVLELRLPDLPRSFVFECRASTTRPRSPSVGMRWSKKDWQRSLTPDEKLLYTNLDKDG